MNYFCTYKGHSAETGKGKRIGTPLEKRILAVRWLFSPFLHPSVAAVLDDDAHHSRRHPYFAQGAQREEDQCLLLYRRPRIRSGFSPPLQPTSTTCRVS